MWCVCATFSLPSILPIIAATSETSVSVRSRLVAKRPRERAVPEQVSRELRAAAAKKNDSFSYLFALECEDFPPGFRLRRRVALCPPPFVVHPNILTRRLLRSRFVAAFFPSAESEAERTIEKS